MNAHKESLTLFLLLLLRKFAFFCWQKHITYWKLTKRKFIISFRYSKSKIHANIRMHIKMYQGTIYHKLSASVRLRLYDYHLVSRLVKNRFSLNVAAFLFPLSSVFYQKATISYHKPAILRQLEVLLYSPQSFAIISQKIVSLSLQVC